MKYLTIKDEIADGVVWSPGPLAGTVWVLPYSGAPQRTARVVHVKRREQVLPSELNRAMERVENAAASLYGKDSLMRRAVYLETFSRSARMSKAVWQDALCEEI